MSSFSAVSLLASAQGRLEGAIEGAQLSLQMIVNDLENGNGLQAKRDILRIIDRLGAAKEHSGALWEKGMKQLREG